MRPEDFLKYAVDPALELLPLRMTSDRARAMIVAICLQETDLTHRVQIGGPARGYPQFELKSGALLDILQRKSTGPVAREFCRRLDIEATPAAIYEAIAYNDILAAGMARLFLWASPLALTGPGDIKGSYKVYRRIWRPGKLTPGRWPERYAWAWEVVND